MIDIVVNAGKYKRMNCSDYFSSMELIPLETGGDCLLQFYQNTTFNDAQIIIFNDDYFFIQSRNNLYSFDRSGKFLHQIGGKGQGPHEYILIYDIFFNTDRPTVFISDYDKILEYDFHGKFVRSFQSPTVENENVSICSYLGDNLFIGQLRLSGNNKYRYYIFDENGETVKCFPNYTYFNRVGFLGSSNDFALHPVRVDDRIYLKDYVNDTVYILENLHLKPAYVFGLGKYTFPIEYLEKPLDGLRNKTFLISNLTGTQKYFFYIIRVPDIFPRPKRKPQFIPQLNRSTSDESIVYGIYNIEGNTNVLLDTDDYLQRGIMNDLNGGLPFFPRYYAGNNVVADIWSAEEMKEMLTDEYFAKQTIKDQQAHQKLKDLMKILQEDDNPVVVVAKLK